MRFTWRCSTRRLRVEAIYLNDSFVRSLGPKALVIRNITGRAHRHYVGGALILLYLLGWCYQPRTALPLLWPCGRLYTSTSSTAVSILVAWVMPKNGRKKRVRWPMVKKRSKLAKSSGRAQRTLFFPLSVASWLRFAGLEILFDLSCDSDRGAFVIA